jgi:hypothetical protein
MHHNPAETRRIPDVSGSEGSGYSERHHIRGNANTTPVAFCQGDPLFFSSRAVSFCFNFPLLQHLLRNSIRCALTACAVRGRTAASAPPLIGRRSDYTVTFVAER